MARVHEYIVVRTDGTHEIIRSNGPICLQQSRQEVGGPPDCFNPEIGSEYTAQINQDGDLLKLERNAMFQRALGNVLIGRAHGKAIWGLTMSQKDDIRRRLIRQHGGGGECRA